MGRIVQADLDKEHAECKHAVCNDAGAHDCQAAGYGAIPQQVWVIWLELALGVVIWEAHKPTQGNCS